MKNAETVHRIALALEVLARDLDTLQEAGRGIPAVEKNAARMRGALRQLEVQFTDLDAVGL